MERLLGLVAVIMLVVQWMVMATDVDALLELLNGVAMVMVGQWMPGRGF